jgi:hypothetical protein
MATSSVNMKEDALPKPDSSGADTEKPLDSGVAFYLNPACKHAWSKLATDLQTLSSEGKTIWKCSTCAEISTTFEWQTPEG